MSQVSRFAKQLQQSLGFHVDGVGRRSSSSLAVDPISLIAEQTTRPEVDDVALQLHPKIGEVEFWVVRRTERFGERLGCGNHW